MVFQENKIKELSVALLAPALMFSFPPFHSCLLRDEPVPPQSSKVGGCVWNAHTQASVRIPT